MSKIGSLLAIPRRSQRRLKQIATILTLPGIVLALIAVGVACTYFFFEPTVLRVAVQSNSPIDQRLIRSASELLATQRAGVRLRPVSASSAEQASSDLEQGLVDLAVLRSDELVNGQLQTVLLVRREAAILMAPRPGKVEKVSDLGKATLGLVHAQKSGSAFERIRSFYNLPQSSNVELAPGEIAKALQERKVDAVFVVGSATSRDVTDVVAEAARGSRDLRFIDIDEAKALSKREPALELIEIDQGTFGGRPVRPAEDLSTVGFSIRLVTTARLGNDTIADLTRQMIAIRQNLNAAVSGAGLIEAPDTDDNSSFVIHPGVKVYVNGERTTLFDRYGDWFYLFLFAGSGLGSLFAAMIGWYQNQQRQEAMNNVLRIEKLFEQANKARSPQVVNDIEKQADAIFLDALGRASRGELGDTQILTIQMAMNELRARLMETRAALSPRQQVKRPA